MILGEGCFTSVRRCPLKRRLSHKYLEEVLCWQRKQHGKGFRMGTSLDTLSRTLWGIGRNGKMSLELDLSGMIGSVECYPRNDGELVVGLKHRVDIWSILSERALSKCCLGGWIGANKRRKANYEAVVLSLEERWCFSRGDGKQWLDLGSTLSIDPIQLSMNNEWTQRKRGEKECFLA